MTKILILGAAGMAGHVMAEYFNRESKYEVLRSARRPVTADTIVLDVTDLELLEGLVRQRMPDVVINCVGMLVQASGERVDQAILVNAYLPNFLALLGRKYDFKLVHISTDCVFSGARGAYSENDVRDGDTPYARTKALGEIINDIDLTIRTSIIGPELKRYGSGLLHWFLTQKGTIKGFSRAYWSGITTLELAEVVHLCITQGVSGLVNVAMSPKISKFDLLTQLREVWDHSTVEILRDEGHVSDKSLISTRTDFSLHLPSAYLPMLVEMREFMSQHRTWYPHYTF